MKIDLRLGDCLEVLKTISDNSVDSIVTDPPYGLSFMNKKWDYDVPSVEVWTECLRVLKPGGHLLSFSGSRTYHRMAVRIEDAGFEIRDQIMWVFGSGFPKSHNIGKAVDKLLGNEREVVGTKRSGIAEGPFGSPDESKKHIPETKGTSEWEGWGTALKPSHEPICVARKPLSEKTNAENVLKWGTGGLNIDDCRIGYKDDKPNSIKTERNVDNMTGWATQGGLKDRTEDWIPNNEGRWPANIILDEGEEPWRKYFYCPKVSKKDREDMNNHPTVKPTDLMLYLIKLVTPKDGIVLEPFMGSGSTGKAAVRGGFNFVGIEKEEEYLKISEARINNEH